MAEHRPPFDPGWNDPPTFNYSNAPPPTKTKLNLNKRIAFPMQSSSSNATELPKVESSAAGLPMPFARVKVNANEATAAPATIGSVPLQPPPASMTNAPKSYDKNEVNVLVAATEKIEIGNAQEVVMGTLRDVNQSLAAANATKVEEIAKRLAVLETMWSEGKIDDKLKVLLSNTARALQDNQFSTAIALQRSIIVDHGSNVCAQWGPALRQLILLKESENAPTVVDSVPDTSVVNEPKFINPLDEQSYGSSAKTVGRVKHL